MIAYYTYDAQGVFIGAVDRNKYEAIPKPCTTTKPPSLTGTEVARWDGSVWEVLAERPPLPEPDPEVVKQARIAELKQLLADTDYVALTDYDKSKPDVVAQRQEWRDELRELEPSDEAPVAPE